MQSNPILIIFLFCFILSANKISAQPELWEVYTLSDQPYVNVVVDKYESDSLYLKYMDQSIVLHQDSIKYLIQIKKSNSAIGALVGALAGGLAFNLSSNNSGAFVSEISKGYSTIIGVFLGAVLGGLIGLAGGADVEYNLEGFDTEQKRIVLSRLFPDH